VRVEVYLRDGFCCQRCEWTPPYVPPGWDGRVNVPWSVVDDRELQIDHVIPVALGGTHEVTNLQTLCSRCNYRKSSKVAA
jgi:hypothetical protein